VFRGYGIRAFTNDSFELTFATSGCVSEIRLRFADGLRELILAVVMLSWDSNSDREISTGQAFLL
jgi:hypothetical protein